MRRIVCAFVLKDDFVDPINKDMLSETGEHRVYQLFVRLVSIFPLTLGLIRVISESNLPNLHAQRLISLLVDHGQKNPRSGIRASYQDVDDFVKLDGFKSTIRELRAECVIADKVDTAIYFISEEDCIGEIVDYLNEAALAMDHAGEMHYPTSHRNLGTIIDYQKKVVESLIEPLQNAYQHKHSAVT